MCRFAEDKLANALYMYWNRQLCGSTRTAWNVVFGEFVIYSCLGHDFRNWLYIHIFALNWPRREYPHFWFFLDFSQRIKAVTSWLSDFRKFFIKLMPYENVFPIEYENWWHLRFTFVKTCINCHMAHKLGQHFKMEFLWRHIRELCYPLA